MDGPEAEQRPSSERLAGRRIAERVRASTWVLLASALHVGVLALARFTPERPRLAVAGKVSERELAVSIEEERDEERGSAESSRADPQAGEVAKALPERVARVRAPSRAVNRGPAPVEPSATEEPDQASDGPSPAEEGPVLSLDQLGVGDKNPFVGTELARERPAPKSRPRLSSQERLDRRLAADQLHADHVRSLGPAGPVLTELEAATRNGEVAVNASALFHCVIDAKGRVVSVRLAESSSDPTPWRRVAKRVAESLKTHVLRVPKTGHGAIIAIRVISREALPSGADPGLDVSVLGIPIQKGRGDKSARIDILDITPKIEMEKIELDSGQVYEVPTIKLPRIFSLAADPSDIGSPARRMVHARVESIEVAPPQAER